MQKNGVFIGMCAFVLLFAAVSCKKSSGDDNKPKTKTELLTAATWKFQKAEAGGTDISSYPELACYIDNTMKFETSTATINEGAVSCSPAIQSTPFPWSFSNNETTLNVSVNLLPGGSGDFTIVLLDETNLVISKDIVFPPVPTPITVTLTFKH